MTINIITWAGIKMIFTSFWCFMPEGNGEVALVAGVMNLAIAVATAVAS